MIAGSPKPEVRSLVIDRRDGRDQRDGRLSGSGSKGNASLILHLSFFIRYWSFRHLSFVIADSPRATVLTYELHCNHPPNPLFFMS